MCRLVAGRCAHHSDAGGFAALIRAWASGDGIGAATEKKFETPAAAPDPASGDSRTDATSDDDPFQIFE
eukprot:5520963-Lingulodinium_polyedra.AAC.1